jgi:predicted  nucleic acid-binding Zn-ribbon protein
VEGQKAPKRFWAQHKTEAVLRLLRGEDLDTLSRELKVSASSLSEWRDLFLTSGTEGLKKRSAKEEAELKRLNEKIGEQTMEIELLREKIRLMEAKSPLAFRRSRK